MQRPLTETVCSRKWGEEVAEYKQGGEGSWAPNEAGRFTFGSCGRRRNAPCQARCGKSTRRNGVWSVTTLMTSIS